MSDGSPFRATLAAATLGVAAGVAMGWRWGAADASAAGDRRPDSDARGGGVSAAGDAVAPPSPTPSCAPAPSPHPPSSRGPRRRVDSLGPPIGRVHSCFSRRNGTPRQGGDLVPSARCVLTLAPGLPVDLLAGLDQYSHVWIIYVFHANTNMGGDTRNGGAVKAKVAVPRLDGAAVGALATRTPHRPLPLGLSLGRVVAVDPAAGTLTLGGADLVDGTPVLDVKPYVPFCDRVERAVAPAWVGREAADRDEPLAVTRVESAEGAEDAVATAYEASVKERRRRRLQREHASEERGGAGTRTGRARHKGKRNGGERNGGGGGFRAESRGASARASEIRHSPSETCRRVFQTRRLRNAPRGRRRRAVRLVSNPRTRCIPVAPPSSRSRARFWRWTCARFASGGRRRSVVNSPPIA